MSESEGPVSDSVRIYDDIPSGEYKDGAFYIDSEEEYPVNIPKENLQNPLNYLVEEKKAPEVELRVDNVNGREQLSVNSRGRFSKTKWTELVKSAFSDGVKIGRQKMYDKMQARVDKLKLSIGKMKEAKRYEEKKKWKYALLRHGAFRVNNLRRRRLRANRFRYRRFY